MERTRSVVDVANVCARAIRYRGWVSNVRELTPRRTPEMTFQFLDVERSTNGEDWTSQSPRDPLFEVLLERYDVTRTLDVKKVDDVVRAITLGSTHIPPEDEFLVNALDHLHERKYKFAILEAVNGLEILLSHVLDEFLFFQTLMPGKYRKALLGSPQFSLEFRLKGLLYLVLQDSDFQAFSMEKVLKFVSWRNKVVHGLDARRGSGRYDLPQELVQLSPEHRHSQVSEHLYEIGTLMSILSRLGLELGSADDMGIRPKKLEELDPR